MVMHTNVRNFLIILQSTVIRNVGKVEISLTHSLRVSLSEWRKSGKLREHYVFTYVHIPRVKVTTITTTTRAEGMVVWCVEKCGLATNGISIHRMNMLQVPGRTDSELFSSSLAKV